MMKSVFMEVWVSERIQQNKNRPKTNKNTRMGPREAVASKRKIIVRIQVFVAKVTELSIVK